MEVPAAQPHSSGQPASHAHMAAPPLLQLPTSVLQHITTLCGCKQAALSLRAACRTLRDVPQPAAIQLTYRVRREDEGHLQAAWRQDLSLGKALAARWPGVRAATVDASFQHTPAGLKGEWFACLGTMFQADWQAMWTALDEAADQLVHWGQLREVAVCGFVASEKLVATVVASCASLSFLQLQVLHLPSLDPLPPCVPQSLATHLHLSLQHLATCSSLRTLDLLVEHQGVLSGPSFAAALAHLTQLQALELDVSDTLDATDLSRQLSRLSQLTKLCIGCCEITGEWRVGPFPRLHTLCVEYTCASQHVDPPPCVVHGCPELVHVTLQSEASLRSAGAAAVLPPNAAAVLPALQQLVLDDTTTLVNADVAWLAACCPQLADFTAGGLSIEGPVQACLPRLKQVQVDSLMLEQVLLVEVMPSLTHVAWYMEDPNEEDFETACCFHGHPTLSCLSAPAVWLVEEAAWAVLSCPQLAFLEVGALQVPAGFAAASACGSLRELHLHELHCPLPLAHLAPGLTWLDVADMRHTPASFLHAHPSNLHVSTSMHWADAGEAPVPGTATVAAAAPDAGAGSCPPAAAATACMTANASTTSRPLPAAASDSTAASGAAGTSAVSDNAGVAAITAVAASANSTGSHEGAIASPPPTPAAAPDAALASLHLQLVLQDPPATNWLALSEGMDLGYWQPGRVPPAWLRGSCSSITHLTISGLESQTMVLQVERLLPWLPAVQVLRWGGVRSGELGRALALVRRNQAMLARFSPHATWHHGEVVSQTLVALAPAVVGAMRQLRELELRWLWDVVADGARNDVPPPLTLWLRALSQSSSLQVVRICLRGGQAQDGGVRQEEELESAVLQQVALVGGPLPFVVQLAV